MAIDKLLKSRSVRVAESTLRKKFKTLRRFANKKTNLNQVYYESIKDELDIKPRIESSNIINVLKEEFHGESPIDFGYYSNIWTQEILLEVVKNVKKRTISKNVSTIMAGDLNIANKQCNLAKDIIEDLVESNDIVDLVFWIADVRELIVDEEGNKEEFSMFVEITKGVGNNSDFYVNRSDKIGLIARYFDKACKNTVILTNKPLNRKLLLKSGKKAETLKDVTTVIVDANRSELYGKYLMNIDRDSLHMDRFVIFDKIDSEIKKLKRSNKNRIWTVDELKEIVKEQLQWK